MKKLYPPSQREIAAALEGLIFKYGIRIGPNPDLDTDDAHERAWEASVIVHGVGPQHTVYGATPMKALTECIARAKGAGTLKPTKAWEARELHRRDLLKQHRLNKVNQD